MTLEFVAALAFIAIGLSFTALGRALHAESSARSTLIWLHDEDDRPDVAVTAWGTFDVRRPS